MPCENRSQMICPVRITYVGHKSQMNCTLLLNLGWRRLGAPLARKGGRDAEHARVRARGAGIGAGPTCPRTALRLHSPHRHVGQHKRGLAGAASSQTAAILFQQLRLWAVFGSLGGFFVCATHPPGLQLRRIRMLPRWLIGAGDRAGASRSRRVNTRSFHGRIG